MVECNGARQHPPTEELHGLMVRRHRRELHGCGLRRDREGGVARGRRHGRVALALVRGRDSAHLAMSYHGRGVATKIGDTPRTLTHVYVDVHVTAYEHVYESAYVAACAQVYAYVYVYANLCVWTCPRVWVYLCECMFASLCICTLAYLTVLSK